MTVHAIEHRLPRMIVLTTIRALGLLLPALSASPPPTGWDVSIACRVQMARGDVNAAATACPDLSDFERLRSVMGQRSVLGSATTPRPAKRRPTPVKASKAEGSRRAQVSTLVESTEALHQSVPTGVLEEALVLEALSLAVDVSLLPSSSQWPLPELPTPSPELPPMKDELIGAAQDALSRGTQRLRDAQSRLQPGAPESMRQSALRVAEERALLHQKLVLAMEDALEKDPNLSKSVWLHLAATYGEGAMTNKADELLSLLRKIAPNDPNALIAALWQAGSALRVSPKPAAMRALDDFELLDPAYVSLYRAIAAWRSGDQRRLGPNLDGALKAKAPLVKATALCLSALLEVNARPLQAAKSWETAAGLLDTPDVAKASERARLRASIAYARAALAGESIALLPVEHLPAVHLLATASGQAALAATALNALLDAQPLRQAHLAMALATLDTSAPDAASDDLLSGLIKRFTSLPASPPVAVMVGELRVRLEARLTMKLDRGPTTTSDAAADEKARERLGLLVDLRLLKFPLTSAELFPFARKLATAGLDDRASALLRRVREGDPDPARRLEAGLLMLTSTMTRARSLGARGEALGAFLDGPPATALPPPVVRALLDAQTALLTTMSGGTERDIIFVDHVALRATFGQGAELVDGLSGVIERHAHTALGLRAAFVALQGTPKDRQDRDATRYARMRLGPPEREAELRAALGKILDELKANIDTSLIAQRIYDRAASSLLAFAEQAETAPQRDLSRFGAGLAYALGLRAAEAAAIYREVMKSTDPQLAQTARRQLALLLLESGDRPGATTALEDWQTTAPASAADALSSLVELYASAPERRQSALERFVKLHPQDARFEAFKTKLEALKQSTGSATSGPADGQTSAPLFGPPIR